MTLHASEHELVECYLTHFRRTTPKSKMSFFWDESHLRVAISRLRCNKDIFTIILCVFYWVSKSERTLISCLNLTSLFACF
jgi:hypothetical protein